MKTQKLFSVILALALMLCLSAVPAVAEVPSTVYVGGIALTDGEYLMSGAESPSAEANAELGYAHLENGILTLCNFIYENESTDGYAYDEESCAVIYSETSLEIILEGNNIITSSGISGAENVQGVTSIGRLALSGDGSIEIYAPQGICTHTGEISFNGGEIYISSEMISVTAGTNVDVNGATLIAASDDMGLIAENVTVNSGTVVAMGQNCGIFATVYANGGEIGAASDASVGGVAVNGEIILGADMKIEERSAENDYIYIVSDILLGDVNDDGVIDMFDYLIVKSIYFEKYEYTESELLRADMNADGTVDMFDYLAVKTAYFNGTASGPNTEAMDILVDYILENGDYDAELMYYTLDISETADGYINHIVFNYDAEYNTVDIGGGFESVDGTETFIVDILLESGEDESMVFFLYYCETAEEFYSAAGYISLNTFNPEFPVITDFDSGIEDDGVAATFKAGCEQLLAKTLADISAYIEAADIGINMSDLGFGNF